MWAGRRMYCGWHHPGSSELWYLKEYSSIFYLSLKKTGKFSWAKQHDSRSGSIKNIWLEWLTNWTLSKQVYISKLLCLFWLFACHSPPFSVVQGGSQGFSELTLLPSLPPLTLCLVVQLKLLLEKYSMITMLFD